MTGKELDRDTQRELSVLESQNAEGVARHLVMAMQYLEVDPAFALAHAQAAVRRGGRVAAVREAAGVAAYVAEDFEAALRELRTHRRMSGSHEHLALIIDCERALGRVEKALETAADPAVSELDAAAQAEVAMVVSGIHQDRGDLEAAKSALEIPGLDKKRAFSYSPRLFSAYADVLDALGQSKEAESWARLAVVAEAALGQGQFAEPEIYEIDVLPEDEEAVELPSDCAPGQESAPSADEGADSMGPEESLPSGAGQQAREDRVVADQPQPDSTEAETSPVGSMGPDGAGPDGAGSDGARPDSSGHESNGSTASRLSES